MVSDHSPTGPLRRVLDQLPYPLLLVDLDGRIVHANGACSDLLVDVASGRGRHLAELVADDRAHVEGLLDLWARSASPRPGVLGMYVDDGEPPVPIHALGGRIPDLDLLLVRCRERNDALDGFDELSREVETRNLHQMKRRLESTVEELRATNRRLEDVNEELDRYASVVSHDLRTPLTTVAGFVELLTLEHAGDLDDEGRHILELLERNTRRMGSAIDVLLQLARTKEPPEHVPPLDPGAVVRDVLDQIRSEVSGTPVEVGDLPAVAVDRTHLFQVIQNLLVNSLRYRSSERPLRIAVTGRALDGMVQLTVSDTGIGIPEDERERVFDPLSRGRHVEHIEGTGIGLATCRKIVRSYGGDIQVVERDEPGTAIAFTLPRADGNG